MALRASSSVAASRAAAKESTAGAPMFAKAWATANLVGLSLVSFSASASSLVASRRRANRRKRLSNGGAGRVVSRAVKRLGERFHGRSRRRADRRKSLSDRSLGRFVGGSFQRFDERLNGRSSRARRSPPALEAMARARRKSSVVLFSAWASASTAESRRCADRRKGLSDHSLGRFVGGNLQCLCQLPCSWR